ncbi:MAG TPA: hypothetical protein VMT00_12285 [Thermoanaerobaculia bacterium]|nr:hypothetical protein [Thermoanaerobaculia bacterium]
MTATAKTREPKISVSEANIHKTAIRILSQRLVTPEVQYVQRTLGNTATQADLDKQVQAVRKLPWAAIELPE